MIEHVSSIMKLETGDVILTGTPKGVGAIQAGDVITGGICPTNKDNDIANLKLNVIDRVGGFVKD